MCCRASLPLSLPHPTPFIFLTRIFSTPLPKHHKSQQMFRHTHVLALAILAMLCKIGSNLRKHCILKETLKRIPGSEKGWLGQISEVIANRDRIREYLLEYKQIHAPNSKTFRFQNPANHVIVVTAPANVKHILRDNMKNYIKGPSFTERFEDLLGDGIFNTNGESWSLQRKVASKIFTGSNFNSFFQGLDVFWSRCLLVSLSFGTLSFGPFVFWSRCLFVSLSFGLIVHCLLV
jgi:hypothetical protein